LLGSLGSVWLAGAGAAAGGAESVTGVCADAIRDPAKSAAASADIKIVRFMVDSSEQNATR
jgi:hypothetical protein